MPTKKYPLERGGKPRLELTWKLGWSDFEIKLDGQQIGHIDGKARELKAGREFRLPDGRQLRIQFVQKLTAAELQVLLDGEPLPGSGSDPEQQLKGAYGVMYFVAVASCIAGLLGALGVELMVRMGFNVVAVFIGVVFAGLAWAVQTYRSAVALGIGIALFAIDGVLGLITMVGAGSSAGAGGIVVKVLFIVVMARGFAAIRALRGRERPAAT